MTTDRRTCRRFDVPGATAEWRSEPAENTYGRDARVGDLSRGGVRLLTPEPPPKGAALSLILLVPGEDALELRGRVAWSSVSTGQIHAVGVEFVPYGDEPTLNAPAVLDRLIGIEQRLLAGDSP